MGRVPVALACAARCRPAPTTTASAPADPVVLASAGGRGDFSGIEFLRLALAVPPHTVHTGRQPSSRSCGLLVAGESKAGALSAGGGWPAMRGTFNLTKHKAAVDRHRNIDFAAYNADGTIVGHFVIDELQFASR
jgi:hypothetical protein